MKTVSKLLFLVAAGVGGLASSAFGQLVTYETQSTYQGSSFTFSSPLGQTFTNVSAVSSMTYNFFAGTGGSTAIDLTATFGQWNGSSFEAGTTINFGTISVPASGGAGWTTLTNTYGSFNTYNYEFDLAALSATYPSMIHETYGYLTNAANTYALMLTPASAGSGLALGLTNTDAFAYGATNVGFNDWSFAQIVVAPGSQQLVPVPEASTVASIVGGVFVAGLVTMRMRRRRVDLQELTAA